MWGERWFEGAPLLFATLAFGAGAITLIATGVPALEDMRGLDAIHRLFAELPDLSASIAGVVLMGLATGLGRRVDAAWAATASLLGGLCVYAALRHGHVMAASAAGAVAVLLVMTRRAFYRRSRLVDLFPDKRLALAIAAAFGLAIVGALLWAGSRPEFAAAPWWSLFTDPHIGRPGRALAAGAVVALFVATQWYLLGRARGTPPLAQSEDLARAAAIVASAEGAWPDAELAFSGDKSFVFVDDAFLMVARSGASLIAMGAPVGKRSAWRGALKGLRKRSEELSLRPVVYAAPPDLLPDLLDIGFQVEKIGENAIIELAGFSLTGKSKQNLRTVRRRFAEREGAMFIVEHPPHARSLMDQLRAVSDTWLAAHGGREKAFSLGAFNPDYLARHAIAMVRIEGRVVAFANLWLTADGTRGALDLMRFDPETAPNGLMDFLFLEILLWAQAHGLRTFDLGMAPLAGLAEANKYASLFARIGRLVHERGEALYGFQGLRAFKEKFGPRWEPRYLAAPGAWTLPMVLAEVALLTNGPREKAEAS